MSHGLDERTILRRLPRRQLDRARTFAAELTATRVSERAIGELVLRVHAFLTRAAHDAVAELPAGLATPDRVHDALEKLVLTMLHGPLFGARAHAPRDAASLPLTLRPETPATAGRAERVRARQRAARAAARAIAPAARGARRASTLQHRARVHVGPTCRAAVPAARLPRAVR